MSTLDTARLLTWLIDAEHEAISERNTTPNTSAALDADDRAWAYSNVLGWLRRRAPHRPGNPVDPDATIAAGALTIETDDLWSWLTLQAAGDRIETRAKTYSAIAGELHRFIRPPDPFPHAHHDEPDDPPLAAAVATVVGSYGLGLCARLGDSIRCTVARLKVRP